jgi:hypothetical protein
MSGELITLCFATAYDTVTCNRDKYRLHIFWQYMIAPLDKCPTLRTPHYSQ